ncbi:electroneutral sodium bicarbonate exchanger 1-like isoform X2 [Daphnia pulex]|uniref:electroneutral sodium bicarbonate exchanger 1-like isoform X2 n=1 Tax=Daphnia pulex TaxID=6669 RepID=UPI001EDEACE5|nr:electroneutral sodium bicarbonate exchanger 1-like isoform X2 [Daphnia pulex]
MADNSPLPVPRTGPGDAPKDPGIASNCHQSYTEKDFEGHRAHTMYVGVHVPSNGNKRRSHHRRHRHHHRHQHQPGIAEEASPADNSAIPPSQRVQFILGEEGDGDDGTHEAHPLFSEMEELCYNHDAGEVEWNETARWVKFEEDVEEGGSRWSKPHVATLSLHSLFELRSLLLNGPVLLDADAQTLVQITDLAIDMMANSGHLPFNSKERVREALLRRHRHLYEKNKENSAAKLPIIRSLADIGRNYSQSRNPLPYPHHHHQHHLPIGAKRSFTKSSDDIAEEDPVEQDRAVLASSSPATASADAKKQLQSPESCLNVPSGTASHAAMATSPSAASMLRNTSEKDMGNGNGDVHKGNTSFLKKIPAGAEASNVLVGEVDCLEKPVSAFIRLVQPVVLGDLTEVPVPTRFVFILLGPVGGQASYHEVGRAMATLMSDEVFHEVAYRAKNRDHLLAGVDEFLDAVTVLPPGEWDPQIRIEPPAAIPSQNTRKFPEKNKEEVNEEEEESKVRETAGLYRTGRLFGGLINDVKRKVPWYWSDYKDAMSIQCLAAFTFLYFACLTPLITFGGLLGDATENRLGTMESLCSGFLCGIVYGIFSGQPLTILGSTGPVLVFENILYDFCKRNELDYLGLRFWIGMWIAFILIVLVAIDASAIVCYITRFTEENFALLIATIFIYKAIEKVLSIGQKYPMNPPVISDCRCLPSNFTIEARDDISTSWSGISWQECQSVYNGTLEGEDCHLVNKPWYPNVFLMSIILCVTTYFLCVTLKNMKRTNFFPNSVRQVISDFGVFITICSMSLMDALADVRTPKLLVPDEFKPTWEGRGWVVSPFNNPWWTIPAAIAPAMLATILIFMDQQITAVIVNRRENKLKKGCGYHLDLFVLAILIVVKSILGLPWFVAATVLSINHVNALKLQTECAAPGEKPQFLGVKEQRMTLIMISVMIGLSVFMTPILTYIPMPVLFGVFLYMGTSPLADMQFYDRLLLLFMPTKYQPDHIYLRKVTLRRVHLFTFIQLLCFIVLWAVKEINAISIAFPLMLVVMIGVRKSLDFIFTKYELKVLDDLMPESNTKHKDEEDEEVTTLAGGTSVAAVSQMAMTDYTSHSGKNFQIQLPNGNIMNIPVDSSTAGGTGGGGGGANKAMNISEEVNRSGVWKTVNIGNVLPASTCIQESKPTCRNNRRREK